MAYQDATVVKNGIEPFSIEIDGFTSPDNDVEHLQRMIKSAESFDVDADAAIARYEMWAEEAASTNCDIS